MVPWLGDANSPLASSWLVGVAPAAVAWMMHTGERGGEWHTNRRRGEDGSVGHCFPPSKDVPPRDALPPPALSPSYTSHNLLDLSSLLHSPFSIPLPTSTIHLLLSSPHHDPPPAPHADRPATNRPLRLSAPASSRKPLVEFLTAQLTSTERPHLPPHQGRLTVLQPPLVASRVQHRGPLSHKVSTRLFTHKHSARL
jgi:hypothetical protein